MSKSGTPRGIEAPNLSPPQDAIMIPNTPAGRYLVQLAFKLAESVKNKEGDR